MGMKWGALARMRGVFQYSLSPLEQKAFAGFISSGVPRTLNRIRESFYIIVVPIACILLINHIEKTNVEMSRKSYKMKNKE